jgi:NIPSNAP
MNDETCCPVVELRQYTVVPGGREVLISLFERHFIESQEATGMTVIGQFRDLNNPDRFVWLRGFADMVSRAQQLEEFYGGPLCAGDNDSTIEQLAIAAHNPVPGGPGHSATYGDLKLNPAWDPLRGDPRFEQIVASLAPKESATTAK